MLHVIVDGANVVGSRPDGWWRDRAGAARRLAGRLAAALAADPQLLAAALTRQPDTPTDLRVHLVLEGAASRADDLPTHPALDVVRAATDGDAAIAELAAVLTDGTDPADPTDHAVVVVTADRGLRERVQRCGAATLGPNALLDALPG